jgi:hypothetical protein
MATGDETQQSQRRWKRKRGRKKTAPYRKALLHRKCARKNNLLLLHYWPHRNTTEEGRGERESETMPTG